MLLLMNSMGNGESRKQIQFSIQTNLIIMVSVTSILWIEKFIILFTAYLHWSLFQFIRICRKIQKNALNPV